MNRSLTWLMLACAFAVAASPRLSLDFLPMRRTPTTLLRHKHNGSWS